MTVQKAFKIEKVNIKIVLSNVILRQERRLRVLQNRILRKILGPKRDENGKFSLHARKFIVYNVHLI